ncbi:expressed unknown protein [Seminavis robusta]|uniref:Uncharacterized protein n=1 Tax=Seminavis robusta TaxID=568900 RepID=A0A9N8H284_9STRA|nr:expressed unknown protein [Seminavis robusta]|eukprot:Sro5_g004240.1 n/a (732) ;mRNA; r:96680-98875
MLPSKSKKTKAGIRAPNQPSLFSFWGQQNKKIKTVTSSDRAKSTTGTSRPKTDSSANPLVGNKRRRLDSRNPSDGSKSAQEKVPVIASEQARPVVSAGANPEAAIDMQCFSFQSRGVDEKAISPEETKEDLSLVKTASLSTIKESESVSTKETATSPKRPETKTKEECVNDDEKEEFEEESDKEEEKEDKPKGKNDNNPEGLCEYELLRLRNIARNNARLEALGLLSKSNNDGMIHKRTSKAAKSKRPSKRPANFETTATRRSTRRSTRLAKPSVEVETDASTDNTQLENSSDTRTGEDLEEELDEQVYEVSPVVQYEMEQHQVSKRHPTLHQTTTACVTNSTDAQESATLVPTGQRLAPPQGLSAIYSLNFWEDTNWIVGAGKAGIVALWNCCEHPRDAEPTEVRHVDPIFSWKAHGGRWISEAQFLSTNNNGTSDGAAPSRLATAANDGTVCLWDLRQVSTETGSPKLVLQSDKTLHSSGIFAMDIGASSGIDAKVATGSKDKTVAVSRLREDAGRPEPFWRSYVHRAKVGAVKFRDEHVLATASDDGCVSILDDRMKGGDSSPVFLLESLHQGRPHSVVWEDSSPSSLLLTAGLDSVIQAWDLRLLKQDKGAQPMPVYEYFGHVPTSTRRCKRIHHPKLYQSSKSGRFILTGGQDSHALSMFQFQAQPVDTSVPHSASGIRRTVRSAVFSRGGLPEDCQHADIGSVAVQHELVAATVEGEVLLLRPST